MQELEVLEAHKGLDQLLNKPKRQCRKKQQVRTFYSHVGSCSAKRTRHIEHMWTPKKLQERQHFLPGQLSVC